MGEIIIENLFFSFNNSDILIRCPRFGFKSGNIYALVGSNGSGKTTFLKLILGLLKPKEGIIRGLENESVAFVPDYNGLYDSLSVLENIKFRLSLYNKSYKAEKESVKRLLARYQLDNETHKLVKDLSLGMKKKAALICALAVEPTVLILDEPTAGLDADAQVELSNMLGQFISPERIVICTSHDSDFLDSLPVCCVVPFPMEA